MVAALGDPILVDHYPQIFLSRGALGHIGSFVSLYPDKEQSFTHGVQVGFEQGVQFLGVKPVCPHKLVQERLFSLRCFRLAHDPVSQRLEARVRNGVHVPVRGTNPLFDAFGDPAVIVQLDQCLVDLVVVGCPGQGFRIRDDFLDIVTGHRLPAQVLAIGLGSVQAGSGQPDDGARESSQGIYNKLCSIPAHYSLLLIITAQGCIADAHFLPGITEKMVLRRRAPPQDHFFGIFLEHCAVILFTQMKKDRLIFYVIGFLVILAILGYFLAAFSWDIVMNILLATEVP
jgi:hypothetical protein